jgi:hypothetical protein
LAHIASSAIVGAIAGAVAARSLGAPGPQSPSAPTAKLEAESAPADATLSARVDALERSVRSLEQRIEPLLRAIAISASANSADDKPRSNEAKSLIGDPVFEAAVLDVMERQQEARSTERDRRRKEQVDQWATQLAERLGLTPAQRASVLEIRARAMTDIQSVFARDAGVQVPWDQRQARVEAIRGEAEKKLSNMLDSRQLAEYEKVGPELGLSARLRGR